MSEQKNAYEQVQAQVRCSEEWQDEKNTSSCLYAVCSGRRRLTLLTELQRRQRSRLTASPPLGQPTYTALRQRYEFCMDNLRRPIVH